MGKTRLNSKHVGAVSTLNSVIRRITINRIIVTGVMNNAFTIPSELISLPVNAIFMIRAINRRLARKKAINFANSMSL